MTGCIFCEYVLASMSAAAFTTCGGRKHSCDCCPAHHVVHMHALSGVSNWPGSIAHSQAEAAWIDHADAALTTGYKRC